MPSVPLIKARGWQRGFSVRRDRLRQAAVFILLLPWMLLSLPALAMNCSDPAGLTVYVVRHAERAEDGTSDPPLSTDGLARAQALREALSDVPLAAIHTTHLQRTWQTASPVARDQGIEIQQHPISAGEAGPHSATLAEHLIQHHCGDQVLVVGHSNTVPLILSALTGQPEPELSERDYDFFHQVRLLPGDEPALLRARYGRSNRTAYRVHWQGALRDFHHGDVRGRVPLDSLANWHSLYAVGPLAELEGEVTVIDGRWSVTRVEGGSLVTEPVPQGQAGFLVWSEVPQWQAPVVLDQPIEGLHELERVIERLARDQGVDTERPFPFLISEAVADLSVHVLAPSDAAGAGHLDSALIATRDGETVTLIGFFSQQHAGVFTHAGSRIHVHARLADGHAGHVDRIQLKAPVRLSLPEPGSN